jgi:murein DD-endopeptidase MepM/ murein hydrolase activator NlpD
MTTSYYREEDWYAGEWFIDEEVTGYDQARHAPPFELVLMIVVALIAAGLIAGLSRLPAHRSAQTVAIPQNPARVQEQERPIEKSPPISPVPPINTADPKAFIMPYTAYQLTQGPHGMSYGHYAIDIAAGNGETILSPITGRVSQLFTDAIGNPTLVIENEVYQVTMMHGNYSVRIGQEVTLGDQVGTESNNGNTRDMAGNSCRNRDCGYHTHLNVYDKQAGQNVNPLNLLQKQYTN